MSPAGFSFGTSMLAFVLCAALIAAMLKWRLHWAIDHPNERSLHADPTPRTGGVAVMAGVLAAAGAATLRFGDVPWPAFVLALLLAGVSLADDRGGLPVRLRLGAHLLAAGVFAAYLTASAAPWWWMLLAVLGITAMTNFFNFMDGANGLAGGMAAAGFSCYAVAAAAAAPGVAAFCAAIAAAAAAFLLFNLRARIFMGDSGSVPLGFLAGALGLAGWMRGLWPAWFPLLVFAPFVVDATLTLTRRILRGDRFWQAHREHYYQRLVRSGWSHARLASAEFALMGLCGGGALVARSGGTEVRTTVFATIALLFALICFTTDRRWRHFQARQVGN